MDQIALPHFRRGSDHEIDKVLHPIFGLPFAGKGPHQHPFPGFEIPASALVPTGNQDHGNADLFGQRFAAEL